MAKKVSKTKPKKAVNPKSIKEAEKVTNSIYEIAQKRLKELIPLVQDFKIGETGQTASKRLSNDDYRNTYSNIEVLYSSKDKKRIDELESLLIRYAKRYYKDKCNNRTTISLGNMGDSPSIYIVYVVYNV